MNLLVRQNLTIWQITAEDEDTFSFYMYADETALIKPFLKKTHTKFRIIKRFGLPFFLFRYRKRILFPAALLLSMVLLLYYSGFVWKIEIVGNSSISEDTMIRYLNEKGAGFGSKKDHVDCPKLELLLRKQFDQVIWASVYIKGTKLVVEMQENIQNDSGFGKPDQNDRSVRETTDFPDRCYDLVAAKDATITDIITRSGMPCVSVGKDVKKGETLVSACQEIRDDSGEVCQYYYQSADADVYGIVSYQYKDSIPKSQKRDQFDGEVKTSFFFQWNDWMFESPLFFPGKKQFYISEDYHQLHLADNFYLPVFIGKKNYHSYQSVTEQVDASEAKEEAEKKLSRFLSDLEENGVQIMSKNVRMKRGKNTYTITGEIKACESIIKEVPAVRKDMESENNQNNQNNENNESNQEGTAQDEHE